MRSVFQLFAVLIIVSVFVTNCFAPTAYSDEKAPINDDKSSRIWYILAQPNTMGLLHGLAQRLTTAVRPSRRSEAMWKGVPDGADVHLSIDVEGDCDGEIFVGFFSDARWWLAEPAQVRSFPRPGRYVVEGLPSGKFYVGAMVGVIPNVAAVGVDRSWPKPINVNRHTMNDISLKLSTKFQWNAVHVRPQTFVSDWPKMDPSRMITVRVVDSDGKPVPYCRVTFVERRRDDPDKAHFFHQVGTDEKGYAYCDQIDGLFSLFVQQHDFVPHSLTSRWRFKNMSKLYNSLDRPVITIELEPYPTGKGKVVGRVHDQFDRPLKEFHLNLSHSTGNQRDWSDSSGYGIRVAMIDAAGQFEATGLAAGEYKATASAFDYPTHAYDTQGTKFTIPEKMAAEIEADVELEAKQLLYGRAVYDDGSPVKRAGWIARFGKNNAISFSAKSDGSFRVSLSRDERKHLIGYSSGEIEVNSYDVVSQRITAKVNIDRLSKDPKKPFEVVIPKPNGEEKKSKDGDEQSNDKASKEKKSDAKKKASTARRIAGDAEFVAIDGRAHKLSDYRGKPVLLNVFTTWCGPCRAELPKLIDLHDSFAKEGLVVLSISRGEEPKVVEDFARRERLPFTILIDSHDSLKKLLDEQDRPVIPRNEGGGIGFPTNVLLDRDHNIIAKQLGFNKQKFAQLHERVVELMGKHDDEDSR